MEIVRRAQAGDREAFEMLVDQHATATYRLAAAIVGTADARDITQETFLAAWQQLPRLRKPDAFGPWLRRICVHRSRNWLRARGRRVSPASLDELAAGLPDPAPDFRTAVDARSVLGPAFETLSPDQRAILALHYSMGYSISESADALGVRVGTAKSRLNAGLALLRRALEPEIAEREPEVAS
ncbi:MAG: RNA polymerase sigma factor [Chloroflexi bacterium]|nr:RNA polymerase sigma factor [Chloroflexota bacterium]